MKKYYFPAVVLALFSILFWLLPSWLAPLEIYQKSSLQTRDLFFKIRRISTSPPDFIKSILIVAIDEESCQNLNLRWPWSRKVFASMIRELHKRGAKVIGLNVSFTGLEDGDDASTEELAAAMREHGNVVIGATFDKKGRLVRPSPLLEQAVSRYGYLEKVVDLDYTIRRSYLLRPYSIQSPEFQTIHSSGFYEKSFPLQLIAAHSGPNKSNDAVFDPDLGLVTVGTPHRAVYVDADGGYVINYVAAPGDFHEVPAWKVLRAKVADADIREKVVLVGLTSSVFADVHPTPVGILSGIGIHANEFLSVISGRLLKFVPDQVTLTISWLVSVCVLALFLLGPLWLGILAFVLAFFGLFMGAQAAFLKDLVLEPLPLLTGPALAMITGLFSNSLQLLLENKGLETRVIHDKMTGLYKYEYLRECLDEEWKRCHKANFPLSIVMTDLDRFKKINDTLGHEVGNQMILRASQVIRESARRYDIVSRYGGDEFVILLWHANLAEAKAYKERLRQMYHDMASKLEPELRDSSISIGVASFDPSVDPKYPPDPQRLIEDADKDLFLDKTSRRGKDDIR